MKPGHGVIRCAGLSAPTALNASWWRRVNIHYGETATGNLPVEIAADHPLGNPTVFAAAAARLNPALRADYKLPA